MEPGEDRDPQKGEPGEDRDPQKEELKDLLKEEEPVGLPKEKEPEELLPICQILIPDRHAGRSLGSFKSK